MPTGVTRSKGIELYKLIIVGHNNRKMLMPERKRLLIINLLNMKKLKLPELELEKLSVAEMDRLKAGSGESHCRAGDTISVGSDHESYQGDSD